MADRDLQNLFDATALRPVGDASERLRAVADALDDGAMVAQAFQATADLPDDVTRRRLLAAAERLASGPRRVRRQARLAMVAVLAIAIGGGIVARWLADDGHGDEPGSVAVASVAGPAGRYTAGYTKEYTKEYTVDREAAGVDRSGLRERAVMAATPLGALAASLAGDDPWLGVVTEAGAATEPAVADEATMAALSLAALHGVEEVEDLDSLAAMP